MIDFDDTARLRQLEEGTPAWWSLLSELEDAALVALEDFAGEGGTFLGFTPRAKLEALASLAGVLRVARDARRKNQAELRAELAKPCNA